MSDQISEQMHQILSVLSQQLSQQLIQQFQSMLQSLQQQMSQQLQQLQQLQQQMIQQQMSQQFESLLKKNSEQFESLLKKNSEQFESLQKQNSRQSEQVDSLLKQNSEQFESLQKQNSEHFESLQKQNLRQSEQVDSLLKQNSEQFESLQSHIQQQSEQLQKQLLNKLNELTTLTMDPEVLERIVGNENSSYQECLSKICSLLKPKIPATMRISYRAYLSLIPIAISGTYSSGPSVPRGSIGNTLCKLLFDIKPNWTEQIADSWFDERFAELDKALMSKHEDILRFANHETALMQELGELRDQKSTLEHNNSLETNEELMTINNRITKIENDNKTYRMLKEAHDALLSGLEASVDIDESESSREYSFNIIIDRIIVTLFHPFEIKRFNRGHKFTTNIFPGKQFDLNTDVHYVYGSKFCCFVEMKRGNLQNCIKMNGELKISGPITSLMKQIVEYLIGYGTTYGFLSDLKTTILVNFDVDSLGAPSIRGQRPTKAQDVPFKYRVIKSTDTIRTLQAVVMSTIFYQANECHRLEQEKASVKLFEYLLKEKPASNVGENSDSGEGDDTGDTGDIGDTRDIGDTVDSSDVIGRGPTGGDDRNRKPGSDSSDTGGQRKRRKTSVSSIRDTSHLNPDTKSNSLRSYSSSRNDFTILQPAGDYLTEVFKFSHQNFVKNFPDINLGNSNTDIIIKLYDFSSIKDYYTIHESGLILPFKEFRNSVIEYFRTECRALNKIKSHNRVSKSKINSPEIFDQGEMIFTAHGPAPPARPYSYHGYFIIMSFIEDEDIQELDENLTRQGIQQIKLLGKIGILQNDIARRNLMINQGKFYIIDFSHAIVKDHRLDSSTDIWNMKYLGKEESDYFHD